MADLFEVIRGSSVRQLNLVLEAGGNVNIQNARLETPLMSCLINVKDIEKRTAIINALLKYGADVNIQNKRGQTAFMYACILNQLQTLTVLLNQKDIKVNLQDCEGNTGLMYACALGNVKTVKKLLEEHVARHLTLKFTVENNEGLTALQYAEDGYFVDIVSMLSEIISLPRTTSPDKSHDKAVTKEKPIQNSKTSQNHSKTLTPRKSEKTPPQKATGIRNSSIKNDVPTGTETSSVTKDLKQRESDEMNDLLRSVRQCAADIKQICTDHDIDYTGEKKAQRMEDVVRQHQNTTQATETWKEKSRKRQKLVSSDSSIPARKSENGQNLYQQMRMNSTYPQGSKTSRQTNVPNIVLSDHGGHNKSQKKPSFVTKARFQFQDVSEMSSPVFKPVTKNKFRPGFSKSLNLPSDHKRPSSENAPSSKPVVSVTSPRSMSTSLEVERGLLSKSSNMGPSIDEVQPLLNKIWSSYKKPLPGIGQTNGSGNDQLHLPPLKDGLQQGDRDH